MLSVGMGLYNYRKGFGFIRIMVKILMFKGLKIAILGTK